MRFLLIGNFSSLYEEENLHNLTLLTSLNESGHTCTALNIGELSGYQISRISEHNKIITIKNYVDFIIKFFRYSYRCNVIHFLTKGYARPGLMKLMTAVIFGKCMLKKIIITIHPELFSIFGQLRSKMGGQQLLYLSFSLADKIICGDTNTYEVASLHYARKEKFAIIPSFFQIPEQSEETTNLKKLRGKNKLLVFSGVQYPSLIFDVIKELLTQYLDSDTGIVVSVFEKKSQQLQHVLEEAVQKFSESIVFIWPDDKRQLSMAFARSDLVIRTLSCDGKSLFNKFAIAIKQPVHTKQSLFFPVSIVVVKEGDSADLCAYSINKILMEKTEKPPMVNEDFYQKIMEIYTKV
jgi:hypothetical protein